MRLEPSCMAERKCLRQLWRDGWRGDWWRDPSRGRYEPRLDTRLSYGPSSLMNRGQGVPIVTRGHGRLFGPFSTEWRPATSGTL
mgnify:CR=1 FL=1